MRSLLENCLWSSTAALTHHVERILYRIFTGDYIVEDRYKHDVLGPSLYIYAEKGETLFKKMKSRYVGLAMCQPIMELLKV